MSNERQHRGPSRREFLNGAWAAVVSLIVLCVVPPTAFGAAKRGPDLMLSSLSSAPGQLAPGSTFSESFAEKNIGNKRARASTTDFYLSLSAKLGQGATQLTGAVRIPALKARKKKKVTATLAVPKVTAAGSYLLIGCADDRHKVKERNEHNNCRAASGRVTVTGAEALLPLKPPSGTPMSPADCVPTDHPTLSSTNPNCFDGDASDAIFVSPGLAMTQTRARWLCRSER